MNLYFYAGQCNQLEKTNPMSFAQNFPQPPATSRAFAFGCAPASNFNIPLQQMAFYPPSPGQIQFQQQAPVNPDVEGFGLSRNVSFRSAPGNIKFCRLPLSKSTPFINPRKYIYIS